MRNFSEHYFLSEGIVDDLRRALTSNLFKKRIVGVSADKLKYISRVDERSFDRVYDILKREFVSTIKATDEYNQRLGRTKRTTPKELKRRLNKDLGNVYVKNVFVGELDDKGAELGNWVDIKAITVYELSNGGRIILFTTETEDGYIERYIGINKSKANDFFINKIGAPFQQFTADALAKAQVQNKYKVTSYVDDDFYQILKPTKKSAIEPKDRDEEEPKSMNDLGLLDISKNEYDTLMKFWGDGKKGGLAHKGEYKFTNAFKREHFYNNVGNGYKYYNPSSKNKVVYLLDLQDGLNGLMVFEGKESLVWADHTGLLEVYRDDSGSNLKDYSTAKIKWTTGDINDL
jgi:hypothetical protein